MLKKIIKIILPEKIWTQLKSIKFDLNIRKFKKMSNYQIFKTIYQQKLWSPENEKKKLNFILGLVLIMKNLPKNTYLELSNF